MNRLLVLVLVLLVVRRLLVVRLECARSTDPETSFVYRLCPRV